VEIVVIEQEHFISEIVGSILETRDTSFAHYPALTQLRFIFSVRQSRILLLQSYYLKAIFMYKIINGHTAPNLKESFRSNNEIDHSYNLRNRETYLALPMSKKEFGKRCFNYNGASLWNNLPQEAKNSESLSSFKTILNQRIC
jgi:hypothetical protein